MILNGSNMRLYPEFIFKKLYFQKCRILKIFLDIIFIPGKMSSGKKPPGKLLSRRLAPEKPPPRKFTTEKMSLQEIYSPRKTVSPKCRFISLCLLLLTLSCSSKKGSKNLLVNIKNFC